MNSAPVAKQILLLFLIKVQGYGTLLFSVKDESVFFFLFDSILYNFKEAFHSLYPNQVG